MSVQIDTRLPADVNSGDKGQLMRAAQTILAQAGTQIDQFVATNRRQTMLSGAQYGDRFLKAEKLNARWQYNSGLERLRVEIYPVGGEGGGAFTGELNLDGYVMWIRADAAYPNGFKSGGSQNAQEDAAFMILFNGYLIEKSFTPDMHPTNCAFYPILFGKTAMLCGSYTGDVEHLNEVLKNNPTKAPHQIIPPDGWGKYDDGVAPDGSGQSAIAKTLGYWLFDWENSHNPWQYVNNNLFGGGGGWKKWAESFKPAYAPQWHVGLPVGKRGIHFKDAQNSPLKPRGQNGITVIHDAKTGRGTATYHMFVGEFYDRGKFRTVSQAWVAPSAPSKVIAINDSPLIYGTAFVGAGYISTDWGGGSFNLDNSYTKQGPTATDSLMGPHSKIFLPPNTTQYAPDGLNDAAKNKIKAWQDEIARIEEAAGIAAAEISKTQDAILNQALAEIQFYFELQAYLQFRPIESSFSAASPTDIQYFIDQYKRANPTYPVPVAATSVLSLVTIGVNQPGNTPGSVFTGLQAQANATLTNAIAISTDAANAANAVLNAPGPPLNLPDFPDIGDSIAGFSYEYISISGKSWSYT